MKFFNFTQVSNSPIVHLAYPDDAQDTPVPFHRLYCQYSIPHIRSPKNVVPNTASPEQEILPEGDAMSFLLSSSPTHLYSEMEGIQHGYAHDLCSPLPSLSEHSLNYIPEQPNPCTVPEHRLLIHDNDTWLPILYALIIDLQNECYAYILPSCKSKKFLETKVPAINCRVLTS